MTGNEQSMHVKNRQHVQKHVVTTEVPIFMQRFGVGGKVLHQPVGASEADGVAKVRYRNATWDAKVVGARTPGGTVFYICAMDGSTLHISSNKPA